MPKALTQKGLRARARIVAAAEPLFSRRGFYGVSVRELAGAVEMPTASLLHYFPSKERLYGAVLAAIADDVAHMIAGAVADPAADPRRRLRALVGQFADWAEAAPERSNLLLRELLDNPGRLAERSAPRLYLAPVVEGVAGFLEAGIAAGAFQRVNPTIFIVHLAGSTSYFVAARPTLERITGRELATDYRADLIAMIERAVIKGATP